MVSIMLISIVSSRFFWIFTFIACVLYSIIFLSGLIGMGMPQIDGNIDFAIFAYGVVMIASPLIMLTIKIAQKSYNHIITIAFAMLAIIPILYFIFVSIL